MFEENSALPGGVRSEIVPYEFRDEYRLVVSRSAGKANRELRNSDLILLNELYFPL